MKHFQDILFIWTRTYRQILKSDFEICISVPLMKSFVEAQCGYCQLVWMFHTRELNRKVNHTQQRALRIVYIDSSRSFTELLKKDNLVCIHYRNIQPLVIELYKVKHTISNSLILNISSLRSIDYNLGTQNNFIKPSANTTRSGLKSLNFFA